MKAFAIECAYPTLHSYWPVLVIRNYCSCPDSHLLLAKRGSFLQVPYSKSTKSRVALHHNSEMGKRSLSSQLFTSATASPLLEQSDQTSQKAGGCAHWPTHIRLGLCCYPCTTLPTSLPLCWKLLFHSDHSFTDEDLSRNFWATNNREGLHSFNE